MPDAQQVMAQIRAAFRETEHPGDEFLQGSTEGCEPAEVTTPFKGMTDWQQVPAALLDANYNALSFFSEGGFRYFLPAFLIADIQGQLQTADPVFHLTHGFSDQVVLLPMGSGSYQKTIGRSAFVNPRRYGAMTWQDHARTRLSIFTKEEACAIVAYLEYRREMSDANAAEIAAALDLFWYDRAERAPDRQALATYLKAEAEYMKSLDVRKCAGQ